MNVKFKRMPKEVYDVVSHNNSATQALTRLAEGTQPTQRTWFYENKKDPADVIAPVVTELKGPKMAKYPKIASWDLSKLDKFQAQGGTAPFEERLESFEEYFAHLDLPEIVKDPLWQEAKETARERLGFNQTGRPFSIAEVVERGISDQKYNTNSGYPLFMKRKSPEAIAEAMSDAQGNAAIRKKFPFMVGSRAQMGKVFKLARFIFMAPMAVNICGQRFAMPAQEYLTNLAEMSLHNMSGVNSDPIQANRFWDDCDLAFFTPWLGWDRVQKVISRSWYDVDLRFGADYTKMDQHFNVYHALEVYDVLKHYFAPEYWDELKEVIVYPFNAPILTSKGYVSQPHALLSGSEWTNLLETVWNFIFVQYINLLKAEDVESTRGRRHHFEWDTIMVPMGIGDDQLWFCIVGNHNGGRKQKNREEDLGDPERQDYLKAFRDLIIREFERSGLPGNPDKQEGVDDPDESGFLQRHMWSGYNGVNNDIPAAGVYPLVRNVTSQVFPERYHNDKEYDWKAFAIRVIMIAENCINHPLFDWYITEFVANANPNILRFVMLTDSEIDAKWNKVKNMAGFRPNYNQEKQDKPLTQFETFKKLREVGKSRGLKTVKVHGQDVSVHVTQE